MPANDNTVYKTKQPIAGHPHYQCLQTQREMACPPSSKKVRRPNFTEVEVLTLIEEVKKREHVILSKLDNTVTAVAKEFAWEEVTSCVNAVSTTKRKPFHKMLSIFMYMYMKTLAPIIPIHKLIEFYLKAL